MQAFVREQVSAIGASGVGKVPEQRDRQVLCEQLHRDVFQVFGLCTHGIRDRQPNGPTDPPIG